MLTVYRISGPQAREVYDCYYVPQRAGFFELCGPPDEPARTRPVAPLHDVLHGDFTLEDAMPLDEYIAEGFCR